MIRKLLISVILFLSLSSLTYAVEGNVIKIKLDGGNKALISNPDDSLWEYSLNGTTWSVSNSDNGKVIFKKGYETLAEGKFKGSKLTMSSPDTGFYFLMKITTDKVKVNWNDSKDMWELKRKEGKIKAKFNGMDYGKIKFYSDSGKLKVKDRFGKTIASIKPYNKLCFAPGAFLMTELSKDQQIFLTLLLFSKNQ